MIRRRASNTGYEGFICRKGMDVLMHPLGDKAKSLYHCREDHFMESYLCDGNLRFSLHEWLLNELIAL